jgi:hypothetical protein
MRRLAAAALAFAWIALPACAQRSSSHGGFSSRGGSSGRSAPAFHGSSGAPAPNRSAGVRGYSVRGYPGSRQFTAARGSLGTRVGANGVRSPYTGSWRYRRPYRSPYGTVNPYGFSAYGIPGWGIPGWIGPSYATYPDTGGDDNSSAPQNSIQEGYDQQPEEQGPPPWPYGSSQGGPASVQPRPSPTDSEDAITLIFKDGRPPEQIHNYVLTRDTLFVGDKHHPDIPVDQLDLAATVSVNQELGVDFRLPGSSR